MKTLALMFLVLLAGTVEAGEPEPPRCWAYEFSHHGIIEDRLVRDYLTVFGDREEDIAQCILVTQYLWKDVRVWRRLPRPVEKPSCEQRMRAAMRAMDSFVPRVYDKESSVIEGWMKGERTSQEITAARKQWDATMKECVK